MYRVYAHDRQARINLGIRRRLAPLLGNDRRRIELMTALLFSLPALPSSTTATSSDGRQHLPRGPQRRAHTHAVERRPQRRLLEGEPAAIDPAGGRGLRVPLPDGQRRSAEHQPALAAQLDQAPDRSAQASPRVRRGSIDFVSPHNRKVLAFVRRHETERILVVVNLSRYVQYAELDLGRHAGSVPVELFSGRPFPTVTDRPYLVTMGPHSFLWFSLEEARPDDADRRATTATAPPRLAAPGGWDSLLAGPGRTILEAALPRILAGCRWYGGEGRTVLSAQLVEAIPLALAGTSPPPAALLLLRVEHERGRYDRYLVPVVVRAGESADRVRHETPHAVLAYLELVGRTGPVEALLIDGLTDVPCCAPSSTWWPATALSRDGRGPSSAPPPARSASCAATRRRSCRPCRAPPTPPTRRRSTASVSC